MFLSRSLLRLQRSSTKILQPDNYYKFVLVDSRIANWDGQLQRNLRVGPGLSFGESRAQEYALRRLCEEGQLSKALDVLSHMDQQGKVPSVDMYRSVLKACRKRKALAQARLVHIHLNRHGLEACRYLGESVVISLVKCGGLLDALAVFDRLPNRTVFSWTAIICGYTTVGRGREALRMYNRMLEDGVEPDKYTFTTLLKACGGLSDLEEGKRIHDDIRTYGFESDSFVGTCLVDMYSKCGCILDAQNVFLELSQRNVVSWTAMLAAYSQQGQAEKALQLYQQMLDEGVSPNDRTFVMALQACGLLAQKEESVIVEGRPTKSKALDIGRAIHASSRRKGYDSDIYVGNTLVSMYGKCGSMADAKEVFDGLLKRNVVSWNAMLAAYVQQGHSEKALKLYEQMREECVSADALTFVNLLQACGLLAEKELQSVHRPPTTPKALEKGKAIHADAREMGCDSDAFVCNTLVSMYGKCGSILHAKNVFDSLVQRDVVSWNAMITAYVEQSQAEEALQLYEQMCEQGGKPDVRTFVSVLQACGMLAENADDLESKLRLQEKGREIHAAVIREGCEADVFISNTLFSMYGKCGSISDAHDLFDRLPQQDVLSWTALFAAYAQVGEAEKAFELYEQMREEGVSPNHRTFVSALQACGMLAEKEEGDILDGQLTTFKCLQKGKIIHADAWMKGYKSDVFVDNTLMSMYRKCGSILDAKHVFNRLSQHTDVAWTVMLSAYVEQGQGEDALKLYEEVLEEGMSPSDRTFVTVLQACGMVGEMEKTVVVDGRSTSAKSFEKGKEIHSYSWRKGFDVDVFVGNTLVSMYAKCGSILDGQDVFDRLSEHDVVSWNTILAAYVEHGQAEKVLQLYHQMRTEGSNPDERTFVSMLQGCGMLAEKEEELDIDGQSIKMESLGQAKVLHADIQRMGYASDVFISNTLISVYGKCGSIVDARRVFDELSKQNVVSWNALLMAYVEQGQRDKALQVFQEMQGGGMSPNEITLVSILQACSNAGGLEVCRQVHHSLISTKSSLSPSQATTLIHAYGRCASMVDAQHVFDVLLQPNVVSWNALIAGYARQGNSSEILQQYEKMQLLGIKPNGVTFLSLLASCSHAGLVERGVEFFESMSRDHGITPEVEHYVSLVDLLGRAGYFTKVEHVLASMPMKPVLSLWLCLLAACRMHGKVILGKKAFDCAVRLQPKQSAAYVLMLNIYADAGLWSCVKEVKELRQRAGAWKKPGQSWVEHEQEVHYFLVGSDNHPEQVRLYDVLGKVSWEVKEDRPSWQTEIYERMNYAVGSHTHTRGSANSNNVAFLEAQIHYRTEQNLIQT